MLDFFKKWFVPTESFSDSIEPTVSKEKQKSQQTKAEYNIPKIKQVKKQKTYRSEASYNQNRQDK
jgi:hypothetical protein